MRDAVHRCIWVGRVTETEQVSHLVRCDLANVAVIVKGAARVWIERNKACEGARKGGSVDLLCNGVIPHYPAERQRAGAVGAFLPSPIAVVESDCSKVSVRAAAGSGVDNSKSAARYVRPGTHR